jgi:beta-lactamase class A
VRILSIRLLFFLAFTTTVQAQLHEQLAAIAARAHGRVGVACSLPGTPLDCNVNADAGLPMQSVYKFPIAMAVLHAVEAGKLSLSTEVPFRESDLISPDQHSPLAEMHPHGGISVRIDELLRLAVSESDGVASDILLRTLGGPAVADAYVKSLGIDGIHIVDPEKTLGREVQAQYRNDAQAQALVKLLRLLADHSPLNPEHTALLLRWMTESETGPHRLKGLLPAGTVVAHKTGTSGSQSRVNNATNDVGLITMKDGRKLAIAVLVADSREPQPAREAVIAQIAKAIWQAAQASPYRH